MKVARHTTASIKSNSTEKASANSPNFLVCPLFTISGIHLFFWFRHSCLGLSWSPPWCWVWGCPPAPPSQQIPLYTTSTDGLGRELNGRRSSLSSLLGKYYRVIRMIICSLFLIEYTIWDKIVSKSFLILRHFISEKKIRDLVCQSE